MMQKRSILAHNITFYFKGILDHLALSLFPLILRRKGYRVIQAKSQKQIEELHRLCSSEGYDCKTCPDDLAKAYKKGTIKFFIAYHKKIPLGAACLINPDYSDTPFELYGIDGQGQRFGIQRTVVKKEIAKEVEQLVCLGLLHIMYRYSRRHGIKYWVSGEAKEKELTAPNICSEASYMDFDGIYHMLTQMALARKIMDMCFRMKVSNLCPCKLLKTLWKKVHKQPKIEVEDSNTELILELRKAVILTDEQWDEFKVLFEKVHKGFFYKLNRAIPGLTPAEIRFLTLAKLKLSPKEMAHMLGISDNAIRQYRHRIRKKLNLKEGQPVEELVEFISF